jgi:hypothetical protein
MLKGEQALEFLATQGATSLAVDTRLRTFNQGLTSAQGFDFEEST